MEPNSRRPHPSFRPRLHTGAAAFLVTLLGAPVHATVGSSAIDRDFPIPNTPLASGASVAPNVMLILDDSRKMTENYIIGDVVTEIRTVEHPGATGHGRPYVEMNKSAYGAGIKRTYTYNILAYNPKVTYRPWRRHDGSEYPPMDKANAASSPSFAVTTKWITDLKPINLWEKKVEVGNGLGLDDATEAWFYAPKVGTAANELGNLENYELFRFVGPDAAERCPAVKRVSPAEGYWKPAVTTNPPPGAGGEGKQHSYWPHVKEDCQSISEFDWGTAADGTPIVRTLAEEWQNYANWYGYYRSPLKIAKAAISHGFSSLETSYRVGYLTTRRIEDNNGRGFGIRIPVHSDNGLFRDTPDSSNRSTWFEQVLSEPYERPASSTSGTFAPLRQALFNVGRYYGESGPKGPWGPDPTPSTTACRQNFAIMVTNGRWTPENEDYEKVRNVDDSPYQTIKGPNGASYTYAPAAPYRDEHSDTLADVAMKFWREDLLPAQTGDKDDKANNIVPTSPGDPAFWQHMVTSVVSISPRGTLDPIRDWDALKSGRKGWPDPHPMVNLAKERAQVDDLFHTAVNGHGKFINAMDPEEVSDGLEAALGGVGRGTRSETSMGFNSARMDADSRGYVASYAGGEWSGDLRAYAIVDGQVSSTLIWSAAAEGGIPDASVRKVLTRDDGQRGRTRTVDFPTEAQRTALTAGVADWIRGDRSREGKGLRVRNVLLGDIAHSSPQYVKTDAAEAVFVGANDGMLHAFHAGTGEEMFAYVPGLLDMGGLKRLATAKGFRHRYHVDGPIAIRKDGGDAVTVVGTLGRGGRGLFGLSADLAVGTASTSWEYTDDEDMGMVLAQPQFVTLSNTRQRGALLVPNGINSASGRAALYVLEADTGKVKRKIQVGDDDDTANGLSAVTALDTDGDGRVDRAYAGDMKGNVWRFNLAGAEGEWTVRRVFKSKGYKGRSQPITGSIGVAYHPVSRMPWVFFGTGSYITDSDATDLTTVHSWYGIEDGDVEVVRGDLIKRDTPTFGKKRTKDEKLVRVFSRASSIDMTRYRGWVMDLNSPHDVNENFMNRWGEQMVGDQIIMGGRTLVAASMTIGGSDCGGNGGGYLNAIDAFTGGATSDPFLNIDMNGDGKIDKIDTEWAGDNGVYAGSINMGLGMITNPGILLGPPSPTGEGPPSLVCANGASAATGCITLNGGTWKSRFGRVSWQELQHP